MLFDRLRRAVAAGRRAARPASAGGLPARAALALVHLDDTEEPGAGLAAHEAACLRSGLGCIVVSNRFPPALLGRPGIVFEFAPLDVGASRDAGSGNDLAARYLIDRLTHIVTFWDVVGCTWSGNRADEVLAVAAQVSPRLASMGRRAGSFGSKPS